MGKADNVTWHEEAVTGADRERLNGHRGAVLWYTGLSGSGKSTVANIVDRALFQAGTHGFLLDGDNLRHGLNANLGFSPEDRAENVRRVVEVARLLAEAGLVVSVAVISPYEADRQRARERIGPDRFVEIFMDTPLEECERRDPKGLYARARSGEIRGFTGIDAPYEAPSSPDVHLRSSDGSPRELAESVLAALSERGVLTPPAP